jgi:hypothetical protein
MPGAGAVHHVRLGQDRTHASQQQPLYLVISSASARSSVGLWGLAADFSRSGSCSTVRSRRAEVLLQYTRLTGPAMKIGAGSVFQPPRMLTRVVAPAGVGGASDPQPEGIAAATEYAADYSSESAIAARLRTSRPRVAFTEHFQALPNCCRMKWPRQNARVQPIPCREPHIDRIGLSYIYAGAWVPNKSAENHLSGSDFHVGPHIMIVSPELGPAALTKQRMHASPCPQFLYQLMGPSSSI